ncbi:MAG TPA: ankyrin repeat domain-containing protein [Bryobacteraceae bacterium]
MKWFTLAIFSTVLFASSGVDSLVEALRKGNDAEVRTAVDRGIDINSADERGNTLLMQAAVYSNRSLMEFLLTHGANPRAANDAGHTALMRAIPDLDKIKLLVEHGADVNAATAQGDTALIMAATVQAGADVLRYLIAKGAALDAVNKESASAVMMAAFEGQSVNLKILLDAGANTNPRLHPERRKLGPDAPDIAVQRATRFQRALDGTTPLIGAATAACESCVRMLIEKGDDARARNRAGESALLYAAYHGDRTMVSDLLKAGAPVNIADERGFTPLMMAVNSRTKDPEVVRQLLSNGADVNAKDKAGRSVAEWARTGSRREIIGLVVAEAAGETLKPVPSALPAAAAPSRESVQKTVKLLDQAGPEFFRKAGCISCHNVSIPMIALAEAHRRNYETDPSRSQQMRKQHVAHFAPTRENLLSGYCTVPGFSSTVGYAAIAMHAAGHQSDALTDAFVRCLLTKQQADGHWASEGMPTRPPLHPSSGIPGTAMSVRTLKLYSIPAFAQKTESGISRAKRYLQSAKPVVGDDYAYRLLGLFWAGAAPGQLTSARRDLIAQQRPDGGWAQTPGMQSDAYATGLALSALAMTGTVNGACYRRGVDYLMRTRQSDGSWHVRSRAFGFQPYFESGFPHGHDQWISMAATGWSAFALMFAAEVKPMAVD